MRVLVTLSFFLYDTGRTLLGAAKSIATKHEATMVRQDHMIEAYRNDSGGAPRITDEDALFAAFNRSIAAPAVTILPIRRRSIDAILAASCARATRDVRTFLALYLDFLLREIMAGIVIEVLDAEERTIRARHVVGEAGVYGF